MTLENKLFDIRFGIAFLYHIVNLRVFLKKLFSKQDYFLADFRTNFIIILMIIMLIALFNI